MKYTYCETCLRPKDADYNWYCYPCWRYLGTLSRSDPEYLGVLAVAEIRNRCEREMRPR